MKRIKWIPFVGLGLTLFLSKPHLIYANSGYGGGSGVENDPYLISTPEHLNQLQLDVNINKVDTTGKYYRLTNHIDLLDYDNDSDKTNGNFAPIGYRNSLNDYNYFKGVFDGSGHVISNLEVILPEQNYVGLFGYIYAAMIQDLGMENVVVEGGDNVGGLVGVQGYNSIINRCYVNGRVSGSSFVGGLIGQQYGGEITQGYAIADVAGEAWTGGLVGGQDYGSINESYSVGKVSGDYLVGGFVGYQYPSNSVIENSYWDVEVSEQNDSSGGSVGLRTEQMIGQKSKSNMEGFDFDDVWVMTSTTPMFRWQNNLVSATEDDIQINGNVETMIADVTIPSVSPNLVINPNLPEGSVSPEFSVSNDSVSPIKLELKTFEQTTNTFNDVLPTKYSSWAGLNKQQSQDLALGLIAKDGDGWQVLTTPMSYVANHTEHEIGIIKPTSSVDFSFDVKHGTAFSEAKTVQYKMVFVFDLMN